MPLVPRLGPASTGTAPRGPNDGVGAGVKFFVGETSDIVGVGALEPLGGKFSGKICIRKALGAKNGQNRLE